MLMSVVLAQNTMSLVLTPENVVIEAATMADENAGEEQPRHAAVESEAPPLEEAAPAAEALAAEVEG